MTYIDGFVSPATADRETYLAFARTAAEVFREHGALRLVEGWAHDVPRGEVTDFYRAVQASDGETLVFSWIEWPDKATRDAGLEKAMNDPRMSQSPDDWPFDGRRMIFGGFEAILDTSG